MFYDDLICSLTNSFYSKQSNSKMAMKNTEAPNYNQASSLILNEQSAGELKQINYFSEVDTLFILGKEYKKPIDEKELQEDIVTRIWFTYRRGYAAIDGHGPDSDQGWGCMIRCGQMLLAETFMRISLGRDFKWTHENQGNPFYLKIMGYFRDDKLAPYSVQQIAQMGVGEGIPIGKWFGPNTIAQVLNKLTQYEDSNHLRFYIAMDNCIFIDEVYEAMKNCNKKIKCKQHKKKKICETWDPLLLIIPLRLGLNEFNQDYKEPIKKCFQLKYTVGMIGGKPNQAYYFYGYADDELLYMDPHDVQPYVANLIEDMNDSSYHTNNTWKMKFSQLDPSVALAFVCKYEEDFLELIDLLQNNVVKKNDMHSLFDISQNRPEFDHLSGNDSLEYNSDDEFVLI